MVCLANASICRLVVACLAPGCWKNFIIDQENDLMVKGPKTPRAVMSGPEPAPPSRVLHLRNLPEECTEMDLRQIASQFGMVVRVLFLSRKQQAFVEFQQIEQANMMLNSVSLSPIRLGTRC